MAKDKSDKSEKKVVLEEVSVVFRENRKFDLHIGREVITFTSRERKDIPKEWLKHRDWQNVSKYFVVKGV